MAAKQSNGFTVVEVVLVVLVVGLLGFIGYLFYQNQQETQQNEHAAQELDRQISKNKKSIDKEGNEIADLTEDERILLAAGCAEDSTTCTIKNKLEKVAQVINGDEGGGINIFVAKEDGEWKTVYKGNGDVPFEIEEKYGIPTVWIYPDNPIDNP